MLTVTQATWKCDVQFLHLPEKSITRWVTSVLFLKTLCQLKGFLILLHLHNWNCKLDPHLCSNGICCLPVPLLRMVVFAQGHNLVFCWQLVLWFFWTSEKKPCWNLQVAEDLPHCLKRYFFQCHLNCTKISILLHFERGSKKSNCSISTFSATVWARLECHKWGMHQDSKTFLRFFLKECIKYLFCICRKEV